jgi:hypothetical protein
MDHVSIQGTHKLTFSSINGGEYIDSNGDDLNIASGRSIDLSATTHVSSSVPVSASSFWSDGVYLDPNGRRRGKEMQKSLKFQALHLLQPMLVHQLLFLPHLSGKMEFKSVLELLILLALLLMIK